MIEKTKLPNKFKYVHEKIICFCLNISCDINRRDVMALMGKPQDQPHFTTSEMLFYSF